MDGLIDQKSKVFSNSFNAHSLQERVLKRTSVYDSSVENQRFSQTNYQKPILITCGLPYANGRAHIGHLRTYIPADIFVRSLKKQGLNPLFVCGSDAHGTPIALNAKSLNIHPSELVQKYHNHFDDIFKQMGIDFNIFGSTADPINHAHTKKIINQLMENNLLYKKVIEIAYCKECVKFLPDRYVFGTCPHCGKSARGDECDAGCNKHLEPGELENPTCSICRGTATYKEQEHYFFKLSEFKEFLIEYLEKLGGTLNARNYALGWTKNKLMDWCITRNLDWGIPFMDREDLVIYVWVDAPIGYISFTEKWAKENGKNWEDYWKDDSNITHFIGGDIIYHHCIFLPAMLEGAGYSKASNVVASGMMKIEGNMFSKSRGFVVWVDEDYLKHGFHPDLLRYYLSSYTSHTKELNFSWKVFQEKINSELVSIFGNFLYRVLLFTHKNFGKIPEGTICDGVMGKIQSIVSSVEDSMNNYEFKKAIDTAMSLSAYGNAYFQSNEPWKLIKENKDACGSVIMNCIQIAKALIILFEPILPSKMKEAWAQIGMQGSVHDAVYSDVIVSVESEVLLPKPIILFEKIDDEKIKEMINISNMRIKDAIAKAKKQEIKIDENKKELEFMDIKDEIAIEDFLKLDIRIGKIIEAVPIKKSKKLLQLKVDIGEEEGARQIVAGIKETHNPEDIIGKNVTIIANLKPVKLCGVESRGMVLAGSDSEGGAILLVPENDVECGTQIG